MPHAIELEKKRLSLTYEQMADIIFEKTGKRMHPGLLAAYVSRNKTPRPKTADLIHRSFPRIKREDLLFPPSKEVSAA